MRPELIEDQWRRNPIDGCKRGITGDEDTMKIFGVKD